MRSPMMKSPKGWNERMKLKPGRKMVLLEELEREEKVKTSRVLKVVRVRKWHLSVVSLVTPQGFLSHHVFLLFLTFPLFFHSLSQSLSLSLFTHFLRVSLSLSFHSLSQSLAS